MLWNTLKNIFQKETPNEHNIDPELFPGSRLPYDYIEVSLNVNDQSVR